MENTTQDGNVSWQLSGQLIGPLISSCVALEFVFSLCANLFIVVFTLRNAKAREGLKKSSILLLFNLALTSLIVTIFYMPFVIVASGAGEWIIGTTDTVRDGVCQFTGFIFAYTTSISTYTLAAISFDRFLFIIKPHFHRRYMTWKAALGIVAAIWVLGVLINTIIFIDVSIGGYFWVSFVGGCLPIWRDNYFILIIALSTIPIGIIAVTTIWTFVFSRWFLKRDLRRLKSTLTKPNLESAKSVYSVKIRSLFGIFTVLLFFNVISLTPFFIVNVVGLVIGFQNVPPAAYTSVFILYLLSNVTNPVIQTYFRKELFDTLKSLLCIRKCQAVLFKWRREETINTTTSQHWETDRAELKHDSPSPLSEESERINRIISDVKLSLSDIKLSDIELEERRVGVEYQETQLGSHVTTTTPREDQVTQLGSQVTTTTPQEDQVTQLGSHVTTTTPQDDHVTNGHVITPQEGHVITPQEDHVIQLGGHMNTSTPQEH